MARVRLALWLLATIALGAIAAPLAALLVSPERSPSVGGLLLGVAATVAVVSGARLALELRAMSSRRKVARYVGTRAPELASDVLSAVELAPPEAGIPAPGEAGKPAPASDRAPHSDALVRALAEDAGKRLAALAPEVLVPRRSLRRPAGIAGAILSTCLIIYVAGPDRVASGWQRILAGSADGDDSGDVASEVPLVGDIRLELTFPEYTGRPPLTLPGSSGDFTAMPGTSVAISTTALVPATAAEIRLTRLEGTVAEAEDDAGSPPVLPLEVVGNELRGQLVVDQAVQYRFALRAGTAPAMVETLARSIDVEADQPPVVELYAPDDELDVTDTKRIELAYTTEDDYGIGDMALVWTPESGESGRLPLPAPGEGARTASGKFLWDLATVDLPPGSRVAYHLEVTDNDTVSGPNVGRSRTYYLRVYSPRERHELLLARQRDMFEAMVRLLGGRLVVPAGDLGSHHALNKETGKLVVELGGILADLAEDELAGEDLTRALEGIKERVDQLVKRERELIDAAARQVDPLSGELPAKTAARLGAADKEHTTELEDDVILLADWLDRQRLENMLALNDEIASHRQRLQELFEEFERTGDPQVMEEIERELKVLERKLAKLAEMSQGMSTEVLDQFVNTEAIEQEQNQSCLAEVRALLAAGDAAGAQAKMKECEGQLDAQSSDLEQALSELRGDRFEEQQQKFDELMSEAADLAQAQREVAKKADDLMESYKQSAADLMKEKSEELEQPIDDLLGKLRKRLSRVPERGLTPYSADELPVVDKRLDDVEQMLGDRDLAEALAMARQALQSLENVEAELGTDLDSGDPWNDSTPEAFERVQDALPLARKLVEELDRATPSPSDLMSPEDRREMQRLRRQQQRLRKRTQRLAERVRDQADELPGNAAQPLAEGLDQATEPQQRAGERMRANDPSGARQEARDAADKLEEAQQRGRDGARQRQVRRSEDETVRIPGADEYRAPEEFREEILEAMKKEAPQGFGEQVKRYYEELIK